MDGMDYEGVALLRARGRLVSHYEDLGDGHEARRGDAEFDGHLRGVLCEVLEAFR